MERKKSDSKLNEKLSELLNSRDRRDNTKVYKNRKTIFMHNTTQHNTTQHNTTQHNTTTIFIF